jgi:hypothetical protein
MGRKPLHCGIVPPHGNVTASSQHPQLFAVREHATADGLLFDSRLSSIFVRQEDKMMNLKHAHIGGKITANVNGFITDGKNAQQRSEYRTMLREILNRIEQRLHVVGLTETAAARRADLSKDAIRNIRRAVESGKEEAGASTLTLTKLAPVLETSASWLLEGVESGLENVPPSMARLWAAIKLAAQASPAVQDRIADFAEYQLAVYAKSLEMATKPES